MSKKSLQTKVLETLTSEVNGPITSITREASEVITAFCKELGLPPAFGRLGNVAQLTTSIGFLNALSQEYEDLKSKHKVDPKYSKSAQYRFTLAELLDYLEKEISEKDKFDLLKDIHIRAATLNLPSTDLRPSLYMKALRGVPGGSILIMSACYRLSEGSIAADANGDVNVNDWRRLLEKESGLGNFELVCIYEDILLEKRLITAPAGMSKEMVRVRPYFRLTQLGYSIMGFIQQAK